MARDKVYNVNNLSTIAVREKRLLAELFVASGLYDQFGSLAFARFVEAWPAIAKLYSSADLEEVCDLLRDDYDQIVDAPRFDTLMAIARGEPLGEVAGQAPRADGEAVWLVMNLRTPDAYGQPTEVTEAEIVLALASKALDGKSLAWRTGFTNWCSLARIDEFAAYIAELDRSPEPREEVATTAPARHSRPVRATRVSSPPRDDQRLHQVLSGKYRVDRWIGEGGFGVVYQGTHLPTGRQVAIKMLHPERTKDPQLAERFRREGQLLCSLRSPHTVTTHDFDVTADETLYLVMELLTGASLLDESKRLGELPWSRVLKIAHQICCSLREAHELGAVHRDVKPENVFVERKDDGDFVKLLDFGLAKVVCGDALDPAAVQLTATGQTLGTLDYMAPEQLMGKPLDGRTDLYSLGVIMYELIAGVHPFAGARGPAELITRQLRRKPAPLAEVRPDLAIPQEVDALVLRCLEKARFDRHPSTVEVASEIEHILATSRGAS